MRRSFVAVVVSWLVVVAVGSTLVWAVISRVGDGLGATAGAPLTPSGSSSLSSVGPSSGPAADPSPGQSSGPSPGSPRSSGSPSAEPTGATSSPSSAPSHSSGSSPQPPSPPPSSRDPQPQRATWQGLGGTVVAECTGSAVRQVSVQPDPGFRVEVGNPGPEELEVEFEGREDEEGSHSHVRAVCVAGTPRFSVELED